jgi:hypothetical protein
MTTEPVPAPKKSNKKLIIIIVSTILGFLVLCTVLNVIGNTVNSVPPTPPQQQTEIAATSIAHVATVYAKWYGSTPAAAAPTLSLPAVGDRLDPGPYAMTVTNVETAGQYGDRKAQAGNIFVTVMILFETKTNGALMISPDAFTLQDSNVRLYKPTIGKTSSLQSPITLPKNQSMTCLVSFELPEDAHGLLITFAPTMLPNLMPIAVGLGF